MEKSFRDILSQFLEENEDEIPSGEAKFSSEIPSDLAARLGDWRPTQRENPSHQGVLRYKSQVPRRDLPSENPAPSVAPPPPPIEAEPLIALEDLDKDSRLMVGILAELGASELQSGVSLSRVKKAYRRLAKKYHPDRLPANSSPAHREAAKNAFHRLQKAYDFLCESLVVEESARAA